MYKRYMCDKVSSYGFVTKLKISVKYPFKMDIFLLYLKTGRKLDSREAAILKSKNKNQRG